MPLTLTGTLNESKTLTSFGAYSLVFPYYIAGKPYYAMVLECRNTSNTAKSILRHGKCRIIFLPYSKENFAQHVACGFPGDTPEEKTKGFRFHPVDSFSSNESEDPCPKILEKALQVFGRALVAVRLFSAIRRAVINELHPYRYLGHALENVGKKPIEVILPYSKDLEIC